MTLQPLTFPGAPHACRTCMRHSPLDIETHILACHIFFATLCALATRTRARHLDDTCMNLRARSTALCKVSLSFFTTPCRLQEMARATI